MPSHENRTMETRARDYSNAKRMVNRERIKAIKMAVQDKIHQKISGGPFQQRRAFKLFDRAASGKIDMINFRAALRDIFTIDATETEIIALFAMYDLNQNGYLEYSEFCNIIMEPDFQGRTKWD